MRSTARMGAVKDWMVRGAAYAFRRTSYDPAEGGHYYRLWPGLSKAVVLVGGWLRSIDSSPTSRAFSDLGLRPKEDAGTNFIEAGIHVPTRLIAPAQPSRF